MKTIVVLLLSMVCAGKQKSEPSLFTTSTGESSPRSYAIRLTSCHNVKASGEDQNLCQLEAALLNGNRRVSSLKFGFKMASGNLETIPKSSDEIEFISGVETAMSTLTIKSIHLTDDLKGLLVTQQFGFDPVHRSHFLFAVVKNKIKKMWYADEGAGGPSTSRVEVFKMKKNEGFSHQQDLVLSHDSSASPDTWSIHFYQWDNLKLSVIELETPRPVWAVISGSFANLEDARKFKVSRSNCVNYFYVLDSNNFRKLEKGVFIIAKMFTAKSKADEELAKIKSCDEKTKAYVKQAI